MDFWTYMDLIVRSKPPQWLVMHDNDHSGHNEFLTLKNDLSISIAIGRLHLSDFDEPWVKGFPDPHASTSWIDLRWNGLPIQRLLGVHVDGARCMLPLPVLTTMEVPKGKSDFFELIDSIVGHDDYRRYFSQSGMTTTSEPWPER
jgi:hypothetical protein